MKVTISFRHIKHTKKLDGKIKEKSEKLSKFLEGKTILKWSCHYDDGHYYTETSLIGPKFEYHSHSSAENIYKSIELAYQKIQRQLQKEKSGATKCTRQGNLEIMDPEMLGQSSRKKTTEKQAKRLNYLKILLLRLERHYSVLLEPQAYRIVLISSHSRLSITITSRNVKQGL